MGFQLGNDRFRQDGAPPFITLAKHVNTLAVEIDIFNPKAHALHESQTGAVEQFGHQRMGSLNISKQSPDYLLAEYGGQLGLLFRSDRLDFSIQRFIEHLAVEKKRGLSAWRCVEADTSPLTAKSDRKRSTAKVSRSCGCVLPPKKWI